MGNILIGFGVHLHFQLINKTTLSITGVFLEKQTLTFRLIVLTVVAAPQDPLLARKGPAST